MRIRSIGRLALPLGEALRIEMAGPNADDSDTVHVQYYIVTDAGPWALWLSCQRNELDAREAALRDLRPPFEDDL